MPMINNKRAEDEKVLDKYDLEVAEKSYEEYLKNPVTYTHEELCELLELENKKDNCKK